MKRIMVLIVLAALSTLGTLSVQAASRQKKNDRKRDGSGENCTMQGNQTRRGGNGGGDRKRDGSGGNCKLLGDQTRPSCGAGKGACQCEQKRQGCGAGGGTCPDKGLCRDR